MKKVQYIAPEIEEILVIVEQGFAGSADEIDDDMTGSPIGDWE